MVQLSSESETVRPFGWPSKGYAFASGIHSASSSITVPPSFSAPTESPTSKPSLPPFSHIPSRKPYTPRERLTERRRLLPPVEKETAFPVSPNTTASLLAVPRYPVPETLIQVTLLKNTLDVKMTPRELKNACCIRKSYTVSPVSSFTKQNQETRHRCNSDT